ncbi:MAG: 30S ribosomal protein S16 [bacterium]
MLTIRLSRTGKKKQPQYRIVVIEKHKDPWADAIEIVGNYNPRAEGENITLNEERIKHWIGSGAQPSETVHNMLVNAGIIEGAKQKSVTISKKRAAKTEGKKAAAEEKKAADAEKAKEAEAAKAEEAKAEVANDDSGNNGDTEVEEVKVDDAEVKTEDAEVIATSEEVKPEAEEVKADDAPEEKTEE